MPADSPQRTQRPQRKKKRSTVYGPRCCALWGFDIDLQDGQDTVRYERVAHEWHEYRFDMLTAGTNLLYGNGITLTGFILQHVNVTPCLHL